MRGFVAQYFDEQIRRCLEQQGVQAHDAARRQAAAERDALPAAEGHGDAIRERGCPPVRAAILAHRCARRGLHRFYSRWPSA